LISEFIIRHFIPVPKGKVFKKMILTLSE